MVRAGGGRRSGERRAVARDRLTGRTMGGAREMAAGGRTGRGGMVGKQNGGHSEKAEKRRFCGSENVCSLRI